MDKEKLKLELDNLMTSISKLRTKFRNSTNKDIKENIRATIKQKRERLENIVKILSI